VVAQEDPNNNTKDLFIIEDERRKINKDKEKSYVRERNRRIT
jgi:hypothetical protein